MKQAQSSYIGYFWAPDEEEQKLRDELSNYPTSEMVKFTQHKMKPPTYIKTNDFTWAFQEIINTYGIPEYKEVNPSIFAIVSFPFLFGVMFGDIGHGTLMFFFGCTLILLNPYMKGTSMEMGS